MQLQMGFQVTLHGSDALDAGRHLEAVEEQHEELQEQDSWAVSTAGDLQEIRTCECWRSWNFWWEIHGNSSSNLTFFRDFNIKVFRGVATRTSFVPPIGVSSWAGGLDMCDIPIALVAFLGCEKPGCPAFDPYPFIYLHISSHIFICLHVFSYTVC